MRFLLFHLLFFPLCLSLECHSFLDSPLIPLIVGSNNTCSGEYCYRIEYNIIYENSEPNQQSVLMGCFDYPLAALKLGCRRNYEGMVLCVCDTDLCNHVPSSNVVDLPIVEDCVDQLLGDDEYDNGAKCTSNYCVMMRSTNSEKWASATQFHRCQDGSAAPLERFDVFTAGGGVVFPAGTCISYETSKGFVEEMCSCTHSDNCTTVSQYPKESGWPLDTRTKGMINCATLSMFGGMVKCQGHICFISKEPHKEYGHGCIRYDDRYMNKKYKLGLQQILQTAYYFCDKNMCNANEDPDKIFAGVDFPLNAPPISKDCNCFAPAPVKSGVIMPHQESNLTLVLGISIPVAIVLFLFFLAIVYRVYSKQWPLSFLCGKRGRVGQKLSVVSVATVDSKKKF